MNDAGAPGGLNLVARDGTCASTLRGGVAGLERAVSSSIYSGLKRLARMRYPILLFSTTLPNGKMHVNKVFTIILATVASGVVSSPSMDTTTPQSHGLLKRQPPGICVSSGRIA